MPLMRAWELYGGDEARAGERFRVGLPLVATGARGSLACSCLASRASTADHELAAAEVVRSLPSAGQAADEGPPQQAVQTAHQQQQQQQQAVMY